MPIDWTPLASTVSLTLGALAYVAGGMRFRRWAVDDRPGIPKFSSSVETVILWLLYSGGVSVAIIVVLQTLRHV